MAWAGFVFTQTVGDPSRGPRIADAVLADEAARAEVAAPITSAVMSSTGLPAEQRPFVAAQVDRLLLQPEGRHAFAETFAGAWARMLGDDDGRGTVLDVTPFLDDIAGAVPGLDPALIPAEAAVPATVPVPDDDLAWLATLRRLVEASTIPLALVAVAGAGVAFVLGDRGWVLRRVGIWAVVAGGGWLLVPAVAVWATRRWATGADAVISVAVEAAVSGLRPAAIVLVAGGLAAFVVSFFDVFPSAARAARPAPARYAPAAPEHRQRPVAPPSPAARAVPARSPAGDRWEPGPRTVSPTQEIVYRPPPPVPRPPVVPADPADDGDDLWDYYTEPKP